MSVFFKMTWKPHRRAFLKAGGTTIGTVTVGTAQAIASNQGRFLIRPKRNVDFGKTTIEEEIEGIDYVAVTGRERDVKRIAAEYAPDPVLKLNEPAIGSQDSLNAADTVDDSLYDFQWDKQDLSMPDAHDVTRGEGVRVAVVDDGIASNHPDLEGKVNLGLSENFTDDGLGVTYRERVYHDVTRCYVLRFERIAVTSVDEIIPT